MSEERKFIHGRFAGKALCEAFGLDPSNVRRIRLVCDMDDAAYLEVEHLVRYDDVTAFTDESKKYRAVPEPQWSLYKLEDAG